MQDYCSVAIWGQQSRTDPAVPANHWVSMEISLVFSQHVKARCCIPCLDSVRVVFFLFPVGVCTLSTLDQWSAFVWACTRPRWHMRGHASSMCFGQCTCLCACVGECAPVCLPALRACERAPGCACVHELACQLMSPVIQQWACCGLVAGSRGWESHSRLQLSLAARKEGRMPSFSCHLTAAAPRCDCVMAVGSCFEFSVYVCAKVEWLGTSW